MIGISHLGCIRDCGVFVICLLCGLGLGSCRNDTLRDREAVDLNLIPDLDISRVNRFAIQTGDQICTIEKSDNGWFILESERNRAYRPLVESFLILLDTLPAGQGRTLPAAHLAELGIEPFGSGQNTTRLKIWAEGKLEPHVLDFGRFDDNFSKEDAVIIGEKHMLRRAVYSPHREKLFLVDYPFHEVKASPIDWFDYHLQLAPGHLKTVKIEEGERSIQWDRKRAFDAFKPSTALHLADDSQIQERLTGLLADGTFVLPVYGDRMSLLENPKVKLLAEDFNGRRFILVFGETYLHGQAETDDRGSGFLTLKEQKKNRETLCRAIRYHSFDNEAAEAAGQFQDACDIFIPNAEILPLLEALRSL